MSRLDFNATGLPPAKLRRISRKQMPVNRTRLIAGLVITGTLAYVTIYSPEERGTSFDAGANGWTVVGSGHEGPARVEADEEHGGYLVATDVAREAAAIVLDLVVVFDTSGSMEGLIREVREETILIIDALQNKSGDVRLGLVSFALGVRGELSLSHDLRSRVARMREWEASGGTDPGEDMFMGSRKVLAMDWRDDGTSRGSVTKAIIVVTDEQPVDPDAYNNTLASVTQAAVAAGTPLYPIIVGGSPDAFERGQALANASRGQAFRVQEAAKVVEILLSSIDTAIEQADPWMWDAPADFRRALSRAYGSCGNHG